MLTIRNQPGQCMSFAQAQNAANRITDNMDAQFEQLAKKAEKLDQQLTDISGRITKIDEQLKEIEKTVNSISPRPARKRW